MRHLVLSKGHIAIVDDEDYEMVSTVKWHAQEARRKDGTLRVYAARKIGRPDGSRELVLLHRVITGAPKGMEVDHADGNALNNCRANLRVCTKHENQRNQRPQGGRSSALKGVSWHKRDKAWYAYISINDKQTYLGKFLSEREAGMAYDRAAIAAYGEYARTNGLGG